MKILNITYNIVNNIIKIHIKVPILYDEKNINNTNISNNNICINNLDNDKLNLIELFNLQINDFKISTSIVDKNINEIKKKYSAWYISNCPIRLFMINFLEK